MAFFRKSLRISPLFIALLAGCGGSTDDGIELPDAHSDRVDTDRRSDATGGTGGASGDSGSKVDGSGGAAGNRPDAAGGAAGAGAGGTAGKGGSAGTAGAAGSAGAAGNGGSAGVGGSAGAAGSGGAAGTGGSAGSGGKAGSGGSGGAAGASGSGGTAGQAGAAGSGGGAGTGGTAGSGGSAGTGGSSGTGGSTPDSGAPDSGSTGGTGGATGGTAGTAGTGGTTGGTAGTGGTTGGTGGTAGEPDAGSDAGLCDNVVCTAPAKCDATSGTAKCVCPAGTVDTTGDATHCLKDNGQVCSTNDECAKAHCVGGSCCNVACDTPGTCQQTQGTTCSDGATCTYGNADGAQCDDGNSCTTNSCSGGSCVVSGSIDCNDNDQCTTDTCNTSSGCVHAPIDVATVCNDNNPCTSDTCTAAAGCQHADNNAATCTDNDACTTDSCSGGLCVSKPLDCTAFNTACSVGSCANGACQAQPSNVGGTCDDGKTACDSGGKCDANGTCTLSHDACGALAASCTTCTSGADCYNGRLCTCQAAPGGGTPIVLVNGVCKLAADECAGSPCAANATCVDPTPDGSVNGDVKCTCPAGYQGDGKVSGTGCADINECTSNPCGAGASSCNGSSPPGSYSCTCAAGFTSVTTATGPTCVCDMGGTYSLVSTSVITWPEVLGPLNIKVIEASPAAGVPTYQWALRYQKVNTSGSLDVQTIPCGGTAPDFCDVYNKYAHAQYQANQVWGKAKVNSGTAAITASLLGVVPGGTYTEPSTIQLLGISLADPAGTWPQCAACVGATGTTCSCGGTTYTIGNKASWVDADGDGSLGITNLHIPRGGLGIDGTNPDPPYVYSEPTACPRLATTGAGTYTYQEWPGAVGLRQFKTNRWFVGQRTTSAISSTSIALTNNQCVITGNVTGPASGKAKVDLRIQGCETCSGTDTTKCIPGAACTADESNSYDTAAQNTGIASHTFTLTKASNIDLGPILAMADGAAKESAINLACNEMRMTSCPPGKNCTTP